MAKSKPKAAEPAAFAPHPDDAREVQEALEESETAEPRLPPLTPEQLKRWADTGEWPDSSD